jgi:leader peptidase (prepilin peptidase)/N-methyltransferase
MPIAPTYPLIEILAGMLGYLTFRRFIADPSELDAVHVLAWAVYSGFVSLLLVACYTDLRHHIIPDQVTVYAVPAAILGAFVLETAGYSGWPAVPWRHAVLGAAVGGILFAVAALLARFALRREGLGWGDVKLLALIGAFVGPFPGVYMVLLLGSLLGVTLALVHLAWTRRRSYLPLGPSLALAATVYLLYGDVLLDRLFPGIAFISR